MTSLTVFVGAVACAMLATGAPGATAHAAEAASDRIVIGTSREGHVIAARHRGDPDAPVQVVVVGEIHGSEPGGRAVAARLLGASDARLRARGVGLWVIDSMNPDGHRAGTRTNAGGVDLNRNFPREWRRQGKGTGTWSGPAAASEPETRAVLDFLSRVRPSAVIGLHQAFDVVDVTFPRSRAAGRLLATWMGERARVVGCGGPCHGTLTQWADHELGAVAITVELDDEVSPAEAQRAARAVLRLGEWLAR